MNYENTQSLVSKKNQRPNRQPDPSVLISNLCTIYYLEKLN